MGNFRELNVWQKSKSLVVDIYYLTNKKTFNVKRVIRYLKDDKIKEEVCIKRQIFVQL